MASPIANPDVTWSVSSQRSKGEPRLVVQASQRHGPLHGQNGLWWALVLGADLGGNATAKGASANVVGAGDREAERPSDLVLEFAK